MRERERGVVHAFSCVYFAEGGDGCFPPSKTVMLLTGTNLLKFHLIQPPHTSFQDVLVVSTSNLRLYAFFLK